jgi:Protein of unknown function (DUF3108)
MNSDRRVLLILFSTAALAMAADTPNGFPFRDESLHYEVNWPSGLSLGDANLTAHRTGENWDLAMSLDVGIPGFPIADRYHSVNSAEQCSSEFERGTSHGSKKSSEKTTFDYKQGRAFRATQNGGKSEVTIGSCARDALAFLYFARRELGQGRVPPQQDVFFGSSYSVRLEYTGAQTVTVGDKPAVTDRVAVSFRGPASNASFEIFFARDAARTPLLVRIPSNLGTIIMELVR